MSKYNLKERGKKRQRDVGNIWSQNVTHPWFHQQFDLFNGSLIVLVKGLLCNINKQITLYFVLFS